MNNKNEKITITRNIKKLKNLEVDSTYQITQEFPNFTIFQILNNNSQTNEFVKDDLVKSRIIIENNDDVTLLNFCIKKDGTCLSEGYLPKRTNSLISFTKKRNFNVLNNYLKLNTKQDSKDGFFEIIDMNNQKPFSVFRYFMYVIFKEKDLIKIPFIVKINEHLYDFLLKKLQNQQQAPNNKRYLNKVQIDSYKFTPKFGDILVLDKIKEMFQKYIRTEQNIINKQLNLDWGGLNKEGGRTQTLRFKKFFENYDDREIKNIQIYYRKVIKKFVAEGIKTYPQDYFSALFVAFFITNDNNLRKYIVNQIYPFYISMINENFWKLSYTMINKLFMIWDPTMTFTQQLIDRFNITNDMKNKIKIVCNYDYSQEFVKNNLRKYGLIFLFFSMEIPNIIVYKKIEENYFDQKQFKQFMNFIRNKNDTYKLIEKEIKSLNVEIINNWNYDYPIHLFFSDLCYYYFSTSIDVIKDRDNILQKVFPEYLEKIKNIEINPELKNILVTPINF